MSGVIVARRGERIVVAQYPAGYVEALNARLDAIAGESDDVHTIEASA